MIMIEATRMTILNPRAPMLIIPARTVLLFKSCIAFPPLELENQLAAVKCLGVAAWGVTLHSAQSHQRLEDLWFEPAFVALRFEGFDDQPRLLVAIFSGKRNEDVGLSDVAIVFRNLVFQNQMIP